MITPEQIEGLRRRGKKFRPLLTKVEAEDAPESNKLQSKLESLRAQINAANKIIPTLSDSQKREKISDLKIISSQVAKIKKILAQSKPIKLPNIPKSDVPVGDNEDSNIVLREIGRKPALKNPRPYLELAEPYGWIDIKRAAKVSGSRFGFLVGPLAQMEFALVQYAQSILLKEDFVLAVPPVLITANNMSAMGYLDGGGEDEVYHFQKDNLYLVGTAEQAIGPMHRDEVLAEAHLPKRYLAFSSAFRREAGSYGRDTKGIIRVHQFDKLEMFSFAAPEHSDQEHDFLLTMEEKLMHGLRLPYRVVKLCAGDLGWPSARTYDIECWLPGSMRWLETHSTSTATDYQSRNLNIKMQRIGGQKEFVHTLNGTAFAIGRTLVGILENYQRPDGSIEVPKVLRPWMSKLSVLRPD